MVLSDISIKENIKKYDMIYPFNEDNIQPASIDLSLGMRFLIPKNNDITFDDEVKYKRSYGDYYIIKPGQFILGQTKEKVCIPSHLAGEVTGRSSIGRLGLEVHQTAGWIDPGFKGHITLEIVNNADYAIELEAGKRIAQLVLHELDRKPSKVYNGKYQNAKGVEGSKIYQD